MFDKILVANRGEIAVRINEAAQELGIKTVAVYSTPDKESLQVFKADEAYELEGESAADTYLNMDKLIEVAKKSGAQAVHPGYGFLSENAEFAQRCWDAGLVFIGPNPEIIRKMGDKIESKRIMREANVPVVPGFEPDPSAKVRKDQLQEEASRIGYPVIVKAAAGGGGRGMRIVHREKDLWDAYQAASKEAKSAFSDGRVFLERYVQQPRHIEVQVLGDNFGNVIHLFERECSIQRRHQKIIEETPSTAVTPDLREQLGLAAVEAARAVGYNSAGTVEFVLDGETGQFYFLEMNTRLQVEHPITELVTGVDIVKWMIKVAAGQVLELSQEHVTQRGHSVECRVYAENPDHLEFRPSIGKLQQFSLNILNRVGIRHDTGFETGNRVSIHYDPLLAKLITYGETREDCLEKMSWALRNYTALGVETNVEFLRDIITHKAFKEGKMTTHFIQDNFSTDWVGQSKRELPVEVLLAASLFDQLQTNGNGNGYASLEITDEPEGQPSPWHMLGSFGRESLERSVKLVDKLASSTHEVVKELERSVGSTLGRKGSASHSGD